MLSLQHIETLGEKRFLSKSMLPLQPLEAVVVLGFQPFLVPGQFTTLKLIQLGQATNCIARNKKRTDAHFLNTSTDKDIASKDI